jgi:hypothetical protein
VTPWLRFTHNSNNPNALQLLLLLLESLLLDIDRDGAITRPCGIFQRFLPWSVARVADGMALT